jgi:hypothetical protein
MHVTCERARTQIESMHVNVWKIEPRRGRPDNNRPSHGCVQWPSRAKGFSELPLLFSLVVAFCSLQCFCKLDDIMIDKTIK